MKKRLVPWLASLTLLLCVIFTEVGGATTLKTLKSPATLTSSNSTTVPRVKRGYRGHSTGIAYNRINDSGHRNYDEEEEGHGHNQKGDPVGEDGTHIRDFKSNGVGYEHRHGGHCEESKCGYNIRHCPHGCVFNSFLCGDGGNSYDTCCC